MDLPAVTRALRAKVGEGGNLDAALKFDCGGDGRVCIDGRSAPDTVSHDDRDAECTIAVTRESLAAPVGGELGPVTGFMPGRPAVAGDTGAAPGLQRIV